MSNQQTIKPEAGQDGEPKTMRNCQQSLVFDSKEALLWLRFIRDRRWSRKQKFALLHFFGNISDAVSARARDVRDILSSRQRTRDAAVDETLVEQELAWLEHDTNHLISCFDPRYPEFLKHICDPPIALYATGDLGLLVKPKVAIVGSRKPSPVGAKAATEIAEGLSKLGIAVVSGMALGVDGLAHQAALASYGPTIAVMGTGMNIIYPQRHKQLYQQISDRGLVISEYPFGFEPSRYSFPDRNRLVSGLSDGVVIVEAAERSGTLITARLANEQNRELMVVPGAALSQQYAGSHRLIQEGAALVCGAQDVLLQLNNELSAYCDMPDAGGTQSVESSLKVHELTELQRAVFTVLDFVSISTDTVIERTGLSASEVASTLLELELNSMVAATPEGGYIRLA